MYPVQSALPTAPFVPSLEKAKLRYYGIPPRPLFIARSSADPWVKPTGMDEYTKPSELRPVGQHRLCDVWDSGVSAAMDGYLTQQGVAYTSIDPVRIGLVTDPIAKVIIWVGIEPGSLSPERGIDVAVGLRAILLENDIEDVHVEIRASIVNYLREDTLREPPHFSSVSSKLNRLFLLAPRHVLFRVDEDNNCYEYHRSGPRRNVLLMGTNGLETCIQAIKSKIGNTQDAIEFLQLQLAGVDKIEDPEDAERERECIQGRLGDQERDMAVLEQFLANAKKDCGKGGFTQDLAAIEVDTTKIDASNFIGNAIYLGTELTVYSSHGVISIGEMQTPDPGNVDSRGDPTIMVLKRGLSTGLTVGCLNNICSILRKPFKSLAGTYSMEFAVLPCSSKSGPFSEGYSGAAVANGSGTVVGMVTGGSGSSEASDCTYVTPMPFILDCLKEHKYPANILPVPAEAFV